MDTIEAPDTPAIRATKPGMAPSTAQVARLASDDRTKRRPARRWVFSQAYSLNKVQGVLTPPNQLERVFPR